MPRAVKNPSVRFFAACPGADGPDDIGSEAPGALGDARGSASAQQPINPALAGAAAVIVAGVCWAVHRCVLDSFILACSSLGGQSFFVTFGGHAAPLHFRGDFAAGPHQHDADPHAAAPENPGDLVGLQVGGVA
jgi:hypothetical protein